jgi:hypothetical protein
LVLGLVLVLPGLPVNGTHHAIRITDDTMTLETVDRIVAAAGFSQHTAACGHGVGLSHGLLF